MARIAGVDLPREKRVEIGLTYIYGIGRKSASDILAATGVNPDTRVRDLTEDEVSKLRDYIDKNYGVEGDLRREYRFEHQTPDRNRLLSWRASPERPSRPRTEDQNQRPHPQRSQEDDSQQEEVV